MRLSANFVRSEFACKCGCGFDTVDCELIKVVQAVREKFGAIAINSGCRCSAHNNAVGGSVKSQHKLGRAADLKILGGTKTSIVAGWIKERYPSVSVGLYPTFVHVDTRSGGAKYW